MGTAFKKKIKNVLGGLGRGVILAINQVCNADIKKAKAKSWIRNLAEKIQKRIKEREVHMIL